MANDIGEIVTLFRQHESLTRADLGRLTGLSRATVNQRISALLDADFLIPVDKRSSSNGRPARQFAFNRDRGVLLVADVGASAIRAALCNLSGELLQQRSVLADVTHGPEPILTQVQKLFEAMLGASGHTTTSVQGIGLDVPGPVEFETGRVINPPIMTGWDRYDIPAWFDTRYSCPVIVEKDVNAMAFGESRKIYPHVSDMLFLKIGTGVGAGVVAGGRSYRGADGAAGDIGHVQLKVEDESEIPICRCGNAGCVEAYAGGWALVRDLKANGHDVSRVDQAVAMVRAGDADAVRLCRRAGRILGSALADAVSLLNPRVVVVGGQLAQAEDLLLAGMREMIYKQSLPLATRQLQIVSSKLSAQAGVIGLALLVADRVFDSRGVRKLLDA